MNRRVDNLQDTASWLVVSIVHAEKMVKNAKRLEINDMLHYWCGKLDAFITILEGVQRLLRAESDKANAADTIKRNEVKDAE